MSPVVTRKDGKFILKYENGQSKDLTPREAFTELADKDEKARAVLDRLFIKHYDTSDTALPAFLDTHQKEGVKWILSRSRSYLAHAPGAGKTFQAIAATGSSGPNLFIVPPSLTVNWARELEKFYAALKFPFNHTYYQIIPRTSGKEKVHWLAPFIICPDSMLTKPWVRDALQKIKFSLIAVDEASRFKESTAERTIELFGGRRKDGTTALGLAYKARHIVLLDGSPMPNRPMELWAPLYALNPDAIDFMDKMQFGFKYCGPRMNNFGKWEFKHSSNEEELHTKITKEFMHVVSEDDLTHPERRRSLLYMTVDPRTPVQRKWEKENLSKINFSTLSDKSSPGELSTYRMELGLQKVKWVVDYVKERLLIKEESILLFAWHREVCISLAAALKRFKPVLVMGGTKNEDREKGFIDFQAGRRKIIIGNILAMGRGHNLQRADRVIFAEYSWSDELNRQCEKRASRRGSDKEYVRCEYIVAPDSFDEVMLKSVMRKAQTVKRIIR